MQLIEVEELDVCGSLVLSNPATYTASLLEIEYIATLQSFCKFKQIASYALQLRMYVASTKLTLASQIQCHD